MSERDIGRALGRSNPVPDPEHAVADSEADALFAAISRRREAMVLTDQVSNKHEDRATAARPRRFSRRFVVAAAAVTGLIAVPAAALLIDRDTPPLDQEYPPGTLSTTVYGAEAGVGAYCALAMDFDAAGIPVAAGQCGLLRLEGDEFTVVNAEVAPHFGTVKAVAVDSDGTVWIAGPGDPLRSVTDGVATTYPFEATDVAVTADGTVWAIRYDHPPGLSTLWEFDGDQFVEPASGPFAVADEELVAAPDGSLWVLALDAVDFDPETQTAAEWRSLVGRLHDDRYTEEPMPEGLEGDHLTLDQNGSLYAIGGTGRRIDRGDDVGDDEWALHRYDNGEVSTVVIPFPEPNDVVVLADGTVWVSSSLYGAFAYDGEDWVRYSSEDGLPDDEVAFVEMAPDGSVYVGTRLGITRIAAESD
jgi:hypothetical protein